LSNDYNDYGETFQSAPRPPPLYDRPGHELVSTPAEALAQNYWICRDELGFTYPFGNGVIKRPDGTSCIVTTDCYGRCTRLERDASGSAVKPKEIAAEHDSPPWTVNGKPVTVTPEIEQCKRWAADYRAGGRHGLLLSGGVGTGKSNAATWMCIDAAARYEIVQNWLEFVREMRSEYGKSERQFDDRIAVVSKAAVLILEDLEVPTANDDRQLLAQIIDARWRNKLPTIITCNMTLPELEKAGLDARVASRIGSYSKLLFRGQDFRRSRTAAKDAR